MTQNGKSHQQFINRMRVNEDSIEEKNAAARRRFYRHFFQVPFCLMMNGLGEDEAVLFAFLDYWYIRKAEARKWKCWFYCTIETIQQYLNWNRDKQQRVLNKLKDRGLLSIDIRGKVRKQRKSGKIVKLPGKQRWLMVNYAVLEKMDNDS